MKSAYFVPVSKAMSADNLQNEIKKRKEERAEKKPYILLAKMIVPAADFDKMAGNISGIELHRPWSVLSTETEKGAMLCVLIQRKDSTRNILVCTGGYDSPCFASISLQARMRKLHRKAVGKNKMLLFLCRKIKLAQKSDIFYRKVYDSL